MVELPSAGIPPDVVEQRLADLAQIYELWTTLRNVRFVGLTGRDEVHERPDADEPTQR